MTEGCHPGQASPLHARQGTGCCDSAHISGRNGASSCLRSSLSQLRGTRWIRAAGSPTQRQTPSFCPFSLVGKPAQTALLPRDNVLGKMLHPTQVPPALGSWRCGRHRVFKHTHKHTKIQGPQGLTLVFTPPRSQPHQSKPVADNVDKSSSWFFMRQLSPSSNYRRLRVCPAPPPAPPTIQL